jgi:DNA invertase Pin-like site-specific DNA recombinase
MLGKSDDWPRNAPVTDWRHVISYIRFSTLDQAKGDSERRQLAKAEKWCRGHGLTLAPENVLRDLGFSAFRGAHAQEGAFANFLAF